MSRRFEDMVHGPEAIPDVKKVKKDQPQLKLQAKVGKAQRKIVNKPGKRGIK